MIGELRIVKFTIRDFNDKTEKVCSYEFRTEYVSTRTGKMRPDKIAWEAK